MKIDIKPGINLLSIFKNVEYELWFAIGEFVDNSIASYQTHKEILHKTGTIDKPYFLNIEIEVDNEERKIIIRDNAAGIYKADIHRAFKAAEPPADPSGLSEFGMGMKSAGIWLSGNWKVVSKALGEEVKRTIIFDLEQIKNSQLNDIDVIESESALDHHYTVVEVTNIGDDRLPKGRTIGKIKTYLASIYRQFLRDNDITISYNGESLLYEEPAILEAPRWDDKVKKEKIVWKESIEKQEFSGGKSIQGFIAIREKASVTDAGLSLFRRKKLVLGGEGTGTFRPAEIFGSQNSFKYQRIFGELHLEGFNVSFTKRSIDWNEDLETLLEVIIEDLDRDNFPLLRQAENYRVRQSSEEYKKASNKVVFDVTTSLEGKAQEILEKHVSEVPEQNPEQDIENFLQSSNGVSRSYEINYAEIQYKIVLELCYDVSLQKFFEVINFPINDDEKTKEQVFMRLNLTHPFMVKFVGANNSNLEMVTRLVAYLGLAEHIAKISGDRSPRATSNILNEIMESI